jgi:hypothetical protein
MSTAEAFILGFACCLLVYAFVATTNRAVVPVVWTGSGKNKLRPVAG